MNLKLPSIAKISAAFCIILILALPMLPIHPVFAARIFEDGFETGDFSKWTVKSGGYVTSGDAHHGTYKAVLNASGQYDQARFTNVERCFFRAYVMFKSFPGTSGYETPILGIYNTSGIYMSEARVINASGTIKWRLRYFNNGISAAATSEQQKPVLDTWYCVEVEGKSNSTTDAEARIYINGNELTDVSQTGKNNTNLINCAYIWESVTGGVTQWYDDVIVDTSYIGPECTLTVNVDGSGTVAKVPDQTIYNWGTNVTLTANPSKFWSFSHWSGDAFGTDNPITLNMTSNITVTATFTRGIATIHVPGDYPTISAAIAAAYAGDTILVDPGTYNEEVVINKAVNVLGSGAGSTFINGTGVALASSGLVKITAPGDVTFSGFTVQNATAAGGITVGIFSEFSVPGLTYTISYNNIYGTNDPDNAEDYGFYSYGDNANVNFSHNLITQTGANNVLFELHTGATEISYNSLDAGVYGSDAIFIMTYDAQDVTALQNVSYNTFNMGTGGPFDYYHRASAISFNTWPIAPDAKFTNVVIEGNTIGNLESYRRGIGFWNGGGGGGGVIAPLVKDNTITGIIGATESYGIDFIGANAATNASILDNWIYNCSYGVYLRTTDCAPSAQIYFNVISGNTIGLDNTVGSSDVDARYNYWGDPSGPYDAISNPSGLGNPVTANVNYKPYLGAPPPECTLTLNVIGSGTVGKDPDQTIYDWGTNVTLTANPTIGWRFDHWSGDAFGTDNPVTLNVTSDKTITAAFTQILYTLTVATVGDGAVNLNNTGPYIYGDVVELTAVPATGWSFDHWSGDLAGSENPTIILIDGDKTVTATFTWTGTHDVAVTELATSKTGCLPNPTVGKKFSVKINVTVTNIGSFDESAVNLTLCATSEMPPITIGSVITNLSIGETLTLTFTWNTTGTSYGTYTISAIVAPVPGETNTTNNVMNGDAIVVTIPGDLDGDYTVTLVDLVLLANAYGSVLQPGPLHAKWNPNADINGDGFIDLVDLVLLAQHYGQHYP